MDNLELICKLCGHSFKYHNSSEFGAWWCEFENNCPCDEFVIKKITQNGKDSEIGKNLDGFRYN